MTEIVVRRRQADADRTPSEIVVHFSDRRRTAADLRAILFDLQRERGRGVWSDADPELLVGGSVVARLRRREAIEELVERVLERTS